MYQCLKPEIIKKIKDKKPQKPGEIQIPLYLPETTPPQKENSSKEEKKVSRVITIELA